MPKTFYTERDIEDLARQGVSALEIDDDVVLTDLARDKARRLGLDLIRPDDKPPAAPERPYIAKMPSPSAAKATKPANTSQASPTSGDELYNRVREAVMARLGDTVDHQLLDTIIKRVLQNVST
ncbi:MAG: hypothetical protein MAG431_00220 [Chloroflexi bacterium]|nr:hypothetical protein [Chloroflexota bacterium]